MTQEERAEEAEQALEFERLREQGVGLKEIGISRAKGTSIQGHKAAEAGDDTKIDFKDEA